MARMSTEERFWKKVEKGPGCWIWKGKRGRDKNGNPTYGLFREDDGTYTVAHRKAVELSTGQAIPDHLKGLHRCDNPPCVRPDHIFPGTQADNIRDMLEKGRHGAKKRTPEQLAQLAEARKRIPKGEAHHFAKLDMATAQRIRELRATGMKYEDIAAKVGVGKSTVGRVVNQDAWGGWSAPET